MNWWAEHVNALDMRTVRAFGAMAEPGDRTAVARFSVSILEDVAGLLGALKYWGDDTIGLLWYDRGTYLDNYNLTTMVDCALQCQHPVAVDLEGALLLSEARHRLIVPESGPCIRSARFAARAAIRETPGWEGRKNRIGSKGAREHVHRALEAIGQGQVHLIQDEYCRSLYFYRPRPGNQGACPA